MINLNELIKRAKANEIEDIEIYNKRSQSTSISLFNGEVDKSTINSGDVYTIRAIFNGKMASITIENPDIDLDEVINKLKANAKSLTTSDEALIFEGSPSYPTIERKDGGYKNHTISEKINLLKEVEKEAKAIDQRIVLVNYCQYVEEKETIRIVNSKGLDLEKGGEYGVIVLGVLGHEGDSNQNGFKVEVKFNYDEFDPKAIAKKAVDEAISMLGAAPVESKAYKVIIENETMASLLAGFESIFTGDALLNRVTPLADKVGQKIMQDCVNIVDDPLDLESVNAQPFDDEGVACYKKNVIENGVFKTFMHNLKTGKKFNTSSTGNGVKHGSQIATASYNFYIDKGTKTKEELISLVDEGLLITDLSGLHAGLNPISCDFSCQSSGFYIKNGKIERPVTLIVLSGNFLKMMNDILEVGSDIYKGYNGVGAPSILFRELPVSGK